MAQVLCVDFGSTFTKAVLVDTDEGVLRASASVPPPVGTHVLDGYRHVREALEGHWVDEALACSSAGGGLRLAVVGYERAVTAEAGHRVGLSAGAKVVHVAAGPMSGADVAALRAARPDVVLLVGGTDGGNAEVLLHNASRLAKARVGQPVVVAGNADAAGEVSHMLASTGRRLVVTGNVLPQIGVIAPEGARAAIREVFLRHVIGGKGLSRGPDFAAMVRAATPDAMLRGIETFAAAVDGDVLVVDVGGATTDVYSVITPEGEDATLHKDVVAPLWHARTVEGDLGMRWNATGVVEAAVAEHLQAAEELPRLRRWAERVSHDTGHLPGDAGETDLDTELARLAALVAVRRHARPARPGESGRPTAKLAHVVGSGGVLRHGGPRVAEAVLGAVTGDYAGGWRVPDGARTAVDTAYLLFAVGLLTDAPGHGAEVAARLARGVLAAR
ncbi:MAG: glutamate mutase L [Oryzihumus sp.]